MAVNITVTEDSILDAAQEYTPRSGKGGVKYEVADGVQVTIKKVTPELVECYDKVSKKTRIEDGKIVFDESDDRTLHQIALAQCKEVTEAPESFDWKGCSMKVLFRIREDFLFLGSPTLRRPTGS